MGTSPCLLKTNHFQIMAGPETLKSFSPRPSWIRKKLGYPALFIGSTIAKITVRGRWHLPKKGPFIVAANHFSYIDPPFFKYAIRKPINFLGASDQNIDWYFMWAPILYGFIPIDRTNLAPSTIKKAKKALKNGEILGDCVPANHTITFAAPKTGFYQGSGPDITGHIHVVEIGLPRDILENREKQQR